MSSALSCGGGCLFAKEKREEDPGGGRIDVVRSPSPLGMSELELGIGGLRDAALIVAADGVDARVGGGDDEDDDDKDEEEPGTIEDAEKAIAVDIEGGLSDGGWACPSVTTAGEAKEALKAVAKGAMPAQGHADCGRALL